MKATLQAWSHPIEQYLYGPSAYPLPSISGGEVVPCVESMTTNFEIYQTLIICLSAKIRGQTYQGNLGGQVA